MIVKSFLVAAFISMHCWTHTCGTRNQKHFEMKHIEWDIYSKSNVDLQWMSPQIVAAHSLILRHSILYYTSMWVQSCAFPKSINLISNYQCFDWRANRLILISLVKGSGYQQTLNHFGLSNSERKNWFGFFQIKLRNKILKSLVAPCCSFLLS